MASDRPGKRSPLWLSVALAGVLAAVMLHRVEQQHEAHTWLATPATILDSSYHSVPRGGYEAHARFAYAFGGRTYTSTQAAFGHENSFFLWSGLDQWFARYTRPGRVTCYINPANPQQAVLDPNYSLYDLIFGFGSLAVLLVLLAGAWSAQKKS